MRRILSVVLLSACSGDPPSSPPADTVPTPDSGACLAANVTCNGDVLSTCAGAGATPVEETCGWGCVVDPTPACKRLVPTGGGANANDLEPSMLAVFAELSLSGTIDGTTGRINGVEASALGVGFTQTNGIGVFRFKLLAIGGLKLQGSAPIQLVADGPITINGTIDATGSCGIGAPELAGAGGGNGGLTTGADGSLPGGGNGGLNVATGTGGGGGGGWGGVGGLSGGGEFGGGKYGDTTITALRGGGGGGAGVGDLAASFVGGGGGGAVHLISNSRITIAVAGNINAGGCGGRKGADADDEGGGGGAGGSIVLEAPEVSLAAGRVLAVNGGGGGGGGAGSTDGGAGQLSRNQAVGGNAGATGGRGGAGGAGATADGAAGGAGKIAGGGGGAVGWIRINTRTGTASIAGVMSPALDDPNSTATQGTAILQ